MSASNELVGFVGQALANGRSRAEIADVLRRAGWQSAEIGRALAAFADVEFPVPVPRPRPYLTARDAFMYLLLFSTLYMTAYHVGNLWFEFIDRTYVDPATTRYAAELARTGVRTSVATLIVAFPVFLWMTAMTSRTADRDPAGSLRRESKVQRWLTYLTLFVAAGVLIGDFITLIYGLLAGDLTSRFVLKVIVTAVIGGTIFGYYLHDLRSVEVEQERQS